jgi:two-component system, cell cycle sensor histidine kinase and response regulator CckA
VKEVLQDGGYTVLTARTYAEALDVFQNAADVPDLLITDLVLPDGNGRKLYETFYDLRPGLRVLYMSGYSEDVIAHNRLLATGTSFISKPFSLAAFVVKVKEVLNTVA